jgi:hypothetical protein
MDDGAIEQIAEGDLHRQAECPTAEPALDLPEAASPLTGVEYACL